MTARRSTAAVIVAAALLATQMFGAAGFAEWKPGGFDIHKLYEDVTDQFKRGVEAYQLNDLETAVNQLEQARGLQPKSVWVRSYLAETYRKLRRFQEAETEWQTIQLLEPSNINHTLSLAQLCLEQGKYPSAIGYYQQVLARLPGSPEAMLGLAMALEGTNDLDAASDQYKEVIRKHPQSQMARSAQSRLDRIGRALKAQATNKHFPIDPELGEAGLGWWNLKNMPLTVYIDRGAGEHGYREQMRSLVTRAMDSWSSASHGAISFQLAPPDSAAEAAWQAIDRKKPILQRLERSLADVPNDPVTADIHVHWTDNLAGGLGLTWTSRLKNGHPVLRKAHIWISTEKLADGTPVPTQQTAASYALFESQDRMLEEVVAHEFGHALGLPHSSNPNDLMCSGIYGLNALDRVERRELSTRDRQSLAEHYNDFVETGMPSRLLAQLKQETGSPGAPAPGAAPPAGAAPGGASTDGAGSTGTELPPFPGEDKKPGEGQATEDEKTAAEAAAAEREKERAQSAPGPTAYDPMREALFAVRMKQYDKALGTLNTVLSRTPNHSQAHYLKAVVYVMLRQYPQAATEYKEVLRLTPHSDLGRRAQEGLTKIRL